MSEDEESEEGESEGDSESDIGGEDPANQTVIKATNNDSFSLRAQIVSTEQAVGGVDNIPHYPKDWWSLNLVV